MGSSSGRRRNKTHRSTHTGRKRSRKWLREALGTAAAVLVIGFAAVSWNLYQERKAADSEALSWREQSGLSGGESSYGASRDVVEYQGKTWRRNTYIKAILCMGIDRKDDLTQTTVAGAGGQSDGIFLIAQDTVRDSVKILAIPRDTMTKITLTDLSGNVLGQDVQHLTLAYAYGDGREKSCQYMTEAVTELLGGLQIDGYMAVSMGALAELNDAVGGVTVTIDDPELEGRDPAFRLGETVTLQGDQAEAFLRYRNIEESQSAIRRLERQKSYITGFAQAMKEQASREDGLAQTLLGKVAPYMVTNLSKDQYLDMCMTFLSSGQELSADDIQMLPGEGVETELYDEYYPDTEQITQTVLNLFYRVEE